MREKQAGGDRSPSCKIGTVILCERNSETLFGSFCADTVHSPVQASGGQEQRQNGFDRKGVELGGLATENLVCIIWEPVCVVGKGLPAILPLRKLRRAVKENRFYGFSRKPRGFSREARRQAVLPWAAPLELGQCCFLTGSR